MRQVKLGDEVRDTVSGFAGVATGRSVFLNGCARICVQPLVSADGKLPDAHWFDEPQLIVTKSSVVPEGRRDTGGPMPSMPTRNEGKTR